MRHLLTLSATELARRIRTGKVTARHVLEAHIARLEETNPRINAVVALRLDAARAEADAADARVARGDDALPPFHGVPCTIKEAFCLEGMPNTSGLLARREMVATADAPTVARLRAAGAIPLGVTNVSELCMWMESDNRVYGRTSCAYDPARIAGGSSGGEGSAVGAGISPFGLGADIGGSIRMPAFFNGVFGHKPSVGLVPNEGQYPVAEGDALRLLATGPLCRRAEDLWPLLQVLGGEEHRSRLGERSPEAVDLSGLTVLDVEDDGFFAVSRDLKAAQRRAADHLEALGARVQRERIRGFRRALEMWAAIMQTAAKTPFRELLGNGRPVQPGLELLRCFLGRSSYTLPSVGLAFFEGLMELAPVATDRAIAYRDELRAEVLERLGGHGVLLYPSHPLPAPRHGDPLLPPIRWVYTALFNALELPVTQVPLGLNGRGLPLGVQVAAPPDRDDLSIAVALDLERAFGGWVLPRWPERLRAPVRAA
jgi:fatty acid amide hydrolase 2